VLRFGGTHPQLAAMTPCPPLPVQCGPPPAVSNARAFGKPKQRYEIGSIARYQCRHGFVQRRSPVIRCREDGTWEPPQLACRPGECGDPPDPPSPPSICLWGFPFTWGFSCPPQAWLSPQMTERVPRAETTTSPGPWSRCGWGQHWDTSTDPGAARNLAAGGPPACLFCICTKKS